MTVHGPRSVVLLCSAVALILATVACDEAHTFRFVNRTTSQITIEYQIAGEKDAQVFDEESYVLNPGQEVDTGDDPARSGESGAAIFHRLRVMRVKVIGQDSVISEKVYTYAELKGMDFRVEVR